MQVWTRCNQKALKCRSGLHLDLTVQGTQNCAASAGGSRFFVVDLAKRPALVQVTIEWINGVALGVTFKNRIRTEMRERRRRLTLEERSVASSALAKNLLQLMGFKRIRRIGAYMANDGEIDPLPALLDCLQRGYKCFLPVLFPGQRPSVRFANFSNTSKFRLNQYGILEPDLYQQHCLNAIQLEWILLPLVAFDMAGNRLGMGGGYYDSSLALIPHRKNWQRPRLIGLAYEFQRVDQLVVDEWDVQMHSILTDKKLYTVESSHTR